LAAGQARPKSPILNATKCSFDQLKQLLFFVAPLKRGFFLISPSRLIYRVWLWFRSPCGLLVVLDAQAKFVLSDFQERFESLYLASVEGINVMQFSV